jgi:N6-adenosine-specific RNA methylase IME4
MRTVPLVRRWLERMGYITVAELLWVKINQKNEPNDRGFTGRWINHCKEHLVVGMKRMPGQLKSGGDAAAAHPPPQIPGWTLGLDADVLVSRIREASRKPDEIYAMIERMAPPGARKVEIFGRRHNARLGWLTIGNELAGTHVSEPALRDGLVARYGADALDQPVLVGALQQAAPSTTATCAHTPGYKSWRGNTGTTSDLQQHYINTWQRERPQNFIMPSTLATGFPQVGRFREAVARAVEQSACSPRTIQLDLRSVLVHSPAPMYLPAPPALLDALGHTNQFNCLLVNPPWREYGAKHMMANHDTWSADEIAALPITQLVMRGGGGDEPACIFLWCGSWPHQYDQARIMLQRWGFMVVEEVAWLQTSHTDMSKARSQLQHHQSPELPAMGVFQPTYERCLVGVMNRNQAESTSDARGMPFVHRCADADVLVAEMPAFGDTSKPAAMYELIERFCMGTRRLELFATRPRRGWVGIGPHTTTTTTAPSQLPLQDQLKRVPYDSLVDRTRPRNESKRDMFESSTRDSKRARGNSGFAL